MCKDRNESPKSTMKFESVWEVMEFEDIQDGTIRVSDSIHDTMVGRISTKLDYMRRHGITNISVVLTSPGGSAYAAFGIYDILRLAAANGATIMGRVEGYAASAASMIVLQACTVRKATGYSRLHLHEVSQWIFLENQKLSDVQDSSKEMEALTKMMSKILSERTGKSEEEIKEFINRHERWMSAEAAKEWGLIDEII